jgi:hypothetical protein
LVPRIRLTFRKRIISLHFFKIQNSVAVCGG